MGLVEFCFKFELGDKVKVTKGTTFKGLQGKIIELRYSNGSKRYKTDIRHGKWFNEEELEIVKKD